MFTYIDAIILILLLLCVIFGIARGFVQSLTKFCGLTAKLVISFILCKPLAKWISGVSKFDEHLFEKYTDWAGGLASSFNVNLKNVPTADLNGFIKDTLGDGGVPKLFRGLLTSVLNITPESIESVESITMAELVGEALKNLVLVVIAFIAIFIVLCLVIWILNAIERKILRSTKIVSKIDRGLGGAVGVLRAVMYVFGICLVLSIFRNVIIFEDFYATIDSSLFGGPISRLMFKVIDNGIDFNGMVIDWLQTL